MNTLDIILLAFVLVPGIWIGLSKGFIHQAVSIVAVFLGITLSCRFASAVGEWLTPYVGTSSRITYIIAFIIILVVVYVVLLLLGKLVEKVVKDVAGGWLNKLLGVVFAVTKYILLAGMIVMLFEGINASFHLVKEETLSESFAYVWLRKFTEVVFPYLKNLALGGVSA